MNERCWRWVMDDVRNIPVPSVRNGMRGKAKFFLMTLALFADESNSGDVSLDQVKQDVEYSGVFKTRKTLVRYLSILKDAKLIDFEQSGDHFHYCLNVPTTRGDSEQP